MTRAPLLLIAPDAALGQTVAGALQCAGFQTVSLASPGALAQVPRTPPPALVLVDLGAAGQAGLAALRQWITASQARTAIPLLAMSAGALDGDQARLASTLCAGYYPVGA